MALTRRQKQVFDFLVSFINGHGYSPSFEEIGEGLKLSSLATVHKHMQTLEKKGFIRRGHNQSRSVEVVAIPASVPFAKTAVQPFGRRKKATDSGDGHAGLAPVVTLTPAPVLGNMEFPLLGRIAAGQPIEAVQGNETISLADFVRSKEVFVLEVRGDSMQDEAILDGDYVLVEKLKTAHNGDIVVALVDSNDATLKRFYREGDNIRLQPSNVTMKPIIVPAASVEVQGRVIGVLRKY